MKASRKDTNIGHLVSKKNRGNMEEAGITGHNTYASSLFHVGK